MTRQPIMRDTLTDIALPVAAICGALLVFGVLVAFAGVSPVEVWRLLFKGAFGDWFSWQNTLQRAAPLMLTALCVAIPARAGLVIIGGEGALVLGGLACAALPYGLPLPNNGVGTVLICLAGAAAGALWIALAGWLRQYRGSNHHIALVVLERTFEDVKAARHHFGLGGVCIFLGGVSYCRAVGRHFHKAFFQAAPDKVGVRLASASGFNERGVGREPVPLCA